MADSKIDESNLWQWLSKIQAAAGSALHMERIENISGKGTPDVHGCSSGKSFTIELKAVERTELIDCEVSEHQEFWAIRRSQAGGNHWFLIQVGGGHHAMRYLIPGREVGALRGKIAEYKLLNMSYHRKDIKLQEEVLMAVCGNG